MNLEQQWGPGIIRLSSHARTLAHFFFSFYVVDLETGDDDCSSNSSSM